MYCAKCGTNIKEGTTCPKCQNAINVSNDKKNDDDISIGIIFLSIIIPIAGVIIGIVNICKKKSKSGVIYLVVGLVAWVIIAMILSYSV